MYVSVVGARPNFVKLMPIHRRLEEAGKEHVIIHTGQHYDYKVSQAFFDEFDLPEPDYNLGIGSGTHAYQIGTALQLIDGALRELKPSLVITYGDVNSTLAGALAAASLGIPTAHVEAGLRSFDKTMPEERNRVLTDHISDLLFPPTQFAYKQLLKEGIQKDMVFQLGDVMLEVFNESKEKPIGIGLEPGLENYYLATVHRAENTDNKERLASILEAFNELDATVILPIHPRTSKRIKEYGLRTGKNIKVVDPVNHSEFVSLLLNCKAVLTDSGGVQKEAFFAKKPCITLRDKTEWVETVKLKANVLTGADKDRIIKAVKSIPRRKPNWKAKPYGKGDASKKIVKTLLKLVG